MQDERWNTESLKTLLSNFNRKGVIPDKHPFFNRKIGKRRAGLNWGYTKDELIELIKCEEDIIYFANNFCKILTPDGRKLIKDYHGLRDFQEEMLEMFKDNQFSIVLASRQIGKSITVAIFISWYVLFHDDSNVLLLSETGQKAKDLFKKIKEIQDSLPFYMQMGLEYDSTQRRIYENGSSIVSENTTENSGVSGSYKLVYWDEMALLEPEMQEKIFTGVFPTMASFGKDAKFIITSTPRGRNNKFYQLWSGAIAEEDSPDYNGFNYMKIYWHQVEGRDEEWKRQEMLIMGEEGFLREYELSFDADGSLLLNEYNQKILADNYTKYAPTDEMGTLLKLRPDININEFKEEHRQYHISIDIAGGKERDYTVFNIFEIKFKTIEEIESMEIISSEVDFFKMDQVGVIRNNVLPPEKMAILLYSVLTEYMIPENVKLTIETNYEGRFFMKNLFEYKGKRNLLYDLMESMVVEYPVNMAFDNPNAKWEEGIKQNKGSKQESCKSINHVLGNHTIKLSHSVTIDEGLAFGKNKKGSYVGLAKNDDCFMTVINLSNYNKTDDFSEQINNVYDLLDDEQRTLIDSVLGMSDDSDDDIY